MRKELWTGAALACGAALAVSPYVHASAALILGALVGLSTGNPFSALTKKFSTWTLQLSIVGLGAMMNLHEVARAGLQGLGLTMATIAGTLGLGIVLGRWLKTDSDTSLLVSVGTAICGGSAIAATAAALKPKTESVSVALAVVFLLNGLAVLIFPGIGFSVGLNEPQFGLWAALAIHDTSSVVGASSLYGPTALQVGTVVKLARALWIVPLVMILTAAVSRRRRRDGVAGAQARISFPWFILGFLVMAGVFSAWSSGSGASGAVALGHGIGGAARKGLDLALFLIGSGLTVKTLRAVGPRPLLQAVILWVLVSVLTLGALKIGLVQPPL